MSNAAHTLFLCPNCPSFYYVHKFILTQPNFRKRSNAAFMKTVKKASTAAAPCCSDTVP